MKRKLIISENSFKRLFESAGVPDGMYEVACDVLNDIIFNEPSEEEIENMKDYDNCDIEREVETPIGIITYTLFYDDGYGAKLGEADEDSISINYAPFAKGWQNVEERMLPVILHELTHLYSFRKGADEGNLDYIWMNYEGKIEDDVREFLYAIDPNELNARVSSSVAVFDSYYYGTTNACGNFKKSIELTLDNVELRMTSITYVIEQLQNELNYIIKEGQSNFNLQWDENYNFKQWLYGFSLAANDKRIIGNTRMAVAACKRDYKTVLKKELKLYNTILEKYKRKIYKACWIHVNNIK